MIKKFEKFIRSEEWNEVLSLVNVEDICDKFYNIFNSS